MTNTYIITASQCQLGQGNLISVHAFKNTLQMSCLDDNKFSITERADIGSRWQPIELITIDFKEDAEITADICNGTT